MWTEGPGGFEQMICGSQARYFYHLVMMIYMYMNNQIVWLRAHHFNNLIFPL